MCHFSFNSLEEFSVVIVISPLTPTSFSTHCHPKSILNISSKLLLLRLLMTSQYFWAQHTQCRYQTLFISSQWKFSYPIASVRLRLPWFFVDVPLTSYFFVVPFFFCHFFFINSSVFGLLLFVSLEFIVSFGTTQLNLKYQLSQLSLNKSFSDQSMLSECPLSSSNLTPQIKLIVLFAA